MNVGRPLRRFGAALAGVLLLASTLTAITSVVSPAPEAAAVESWTTTGRTTTGRSSHGTGMSFPRIGTVWTDVWFETTLAYPQRVRAGQSFNYERCVRKASLEETTGYEAGYDAVTLGDSGFISQFGYTQYTQGATSVNTNLCRTYSATAPSAGSGSMSIPSAEVGVWGGVGYAGSCCPDWGKYWAGSTADNTIYFQQVYTDPVARNDGPFVVAVGNSVTVSPLANDDGFVGGLGSNVGNPTDRAITSQGTKGTCAWSGNSIVYTHTASFGNDSCTYRVNQDETSDDGPDNGPVSAVVSFFVDRPPTPQPDTASTNENDPVDVDALANDTDPEGHTLHLVSATATSGEGSASIVGGQVHFDPGTAFDHLAPGDSVTTTVSYRVADQYDAESTGQITITVHGEYDTPVAIADTTDADENGPTVDLDPRPNDRSDDGAVFHVRSIDTTGLQGTANLDDDEITFDPDGQWEHLALGETGTTTLTYTISDDISPGVETTATITVRVHGENDAPTAVDDTATVAENASLAIDVTANDLDADTNDVLGATAASIVSGLGSVSVSGGNVVFDAAAGFDDLAVGETRSATVGYTMSDPHGETSDAVIEVTVTGVNDDPTATPDDLTVTEDDPTAELEVIAGPVADTDPDTSDMLTVASVTQPSAGLAGFLGTKVTFDPRGGFDELAVGESTSVSFSYTATDSHGGSDSALVTATVTGLNDAPTATPDVLDFDEGDGSDSTDVLANDLDVDHGSSFSLTSITPGVFADFADVPTVSGSVVTFDPSGHFETLSAGEAAVLAVSYVITDELGASSTGVLQIRVHGVNDGPTGSTVARSTDENTVLTLGDLAGGAADIDGADVLAVTALSTTGTVGSAHLAGGTVTYDPVAAFDHLDAGEVGHDSFAVTVSDGHGGTTTVVVNLEIIGRNDAPTTIDDVGTTDEDTVVTVDVVGNDGDSEIGSLELVGTVAGGVRSSVTISGDSLVVDPRVGFNSLAEGATAVDAIIYTVRDPGGATATGVLRVTVHGLNDRPDGASLPLDVDEGAVGSLDLSAPGADPDLGDDVTVNGIVTPSKVGRSSLAGNVAWFETMGKYEHLAVGETAVDPFTVSVHDQHGATGTATVAVTVHGENDAPSAAPDELDVADRRTPTMAVLGNDTDPDTSDRLRIESVDGSSGDGVGTVSIDGDRVRWNVGEAFLMLTPGHVLTRTFTYTVGDGHGGTASATGTFRLTRTMTNDADTDGNGLPDWYEVDHAAESAEAAALGGAVRPDAALPDTLTSCPVPNDLLRITGRAVAGGRVDVVGSKSWMPFSEVAYYVCSSPVLLGRVTAGAGGFAPTRLDLPTSLSSGTHRIIGVGISPSGEVLVQVSEVRVAVPGELAFTGSSPGRGSTQAALMIVGGAVLVTCARRRRRRKAVPARA